MERSEISEVSSPLTPAIALQLNQPEMSDPAKNRGSMIVEIGSNHSRSISADLDTQKRADPILENRVSDSDVDEDCDSGHSPSPDHEAPNEKSHPLPSEAISSATPSGESVRQSQPGVPSPYRSPSPPSFPPLTTKILFTQAWAWALDSISEPERVIGQKRALDQAGEDADPPKSEPSADGGKRSKSTAEFWKQNLTRTREQVQKPDKPPPIESEKKPNPARQIRDRSPSPIRCHRQAPYSHQKPITRFIPQRREISPITPLLVPYHPAPPPPLPPLHRRPTSDPVRYSSLPLSPLFAPRQRIANTQRQGSYDDRIAEVVARERCRAQAELGRGISHRRQLPTIWRHGDADVQKRLIDRAEEAYRDMYRTREGLSGLNRYSGSGDIPREGGSISTNIISPTTSQSSGARRRVDDNQLEVLMNAFRKSAYPSTGERELLGRQLGMTSRSVQIWFQNRRRAHKVDQQSAIQKAELGVGLAMGMERRLSPDELEDERIIKSE